MSKKEIIKAKNILKFVNEKFALKKSFKKIQDMRKEPRISTATVVESIFDCTIFGKGKSFLQMDSNLRKPQLAILINNGNKNPVVSDTTMHRVLGKIFPDSMRNVTYSVYNKLKENSDYNSLLKLSNQTELKVGVIDGSGMSNKLYSCLGIVSNDYIFMLDAEQMAKKGKELVASTRLLDHAVERLGEHFVDIIVIDGLYKSHKFINQALDFSIDIVVKTKEKRLQIVKDADGLFSNAPDKQHENLEHQKGVDIKRMLEYEYWALDGFTIGGVKQDNIKVVKVIEYNIYKDATETYFLLSTNTSLSGEEIRELGHYRWSIENNGFKMLNALSKSKHVYSDDDNVALITLLIKFLAQALLYIYYFTFDLIDVIRNKYGKMKVTFKFFVNLLWDSIIEG